MGTGPERTSDTEERRRNCLRCKIPSNSPIPRELPPDPYPHGLGEIPISPKAILAGSLPERDTPRKMRGGSSQSEMLALLPLCPAQDTDPGPARAALEVRPGRVKSPGTGGRRRAEPVTPEEAGAVLKRCPCPKGGWCHQWLISSGHLSVRQTEKERSPVAIAPRPPGALPALSPAVTPASVLPSRSSGAGSPIAAPHAGLGWGQAGRDTPNAGAA